MKFMVFMLAMTVAGATMLIWNGASWTSVAGMALTAFSAGGKLVQIGSEGDR